jgi:hypothetical protein
VVSGDMEVSNSWGTVPLNHPFVSWIFHEINHPFIYDPPLMETPIKYQDVCWLYPWLLDVGGYLSPIRD